MNRRTINVGTAPSLLGVVLASALVLSACGYRMAGSGLAVGAGRTLAVPVFTNESTEFRIEQTLTEAVRREMVRRTRYRVVPAATGDVVVRGRVAAVTTAPTIFTAEGRAIAYTIAVDIVVQVADSADGSLLIDDDRVTFRESFEVSNDSAEFVPEDAAAVERLARQFAAYLTTSILRANP